MKCGWYDSRFTKTDVDDLCLSDTERRPGVEGEGERKKKSLGLRVLPQ